MDEERRTEFRDKLSAYLKLYAFLSQIIPYADPELEMLYSYGRFLLPHLPTGRDAAVIKVGDEVALQYYRLERVFFMIERMTENDRIVTRYMADPEFQGSALPILARGIFEAVRGATAFPDPPPSGN